MPPGCTPPPSAQAVEDARAAGLPSDFVQRAESHFAAIAAPRRSALEMLEQLTGAPALEIDTDSAQHALAAAEAAGVAPVQLMGHRTAIEDALAAVSRDLLQVLV